MAVIQYMESRFLEFDKENPRMVEFNSSNISETDLIQLLWKEMAIDELVMSIVAFGFFEHEPLYVMAEEDTDHFIVLEGNRRLAAIRSILNPELVGNAKIDRFVSQITDELRETLEKRIPVIVLDSRKDAWRLLGFKHVNGPAKWGSYAKAKYISEVHNKFGVPLDKIAEQIGDTHKTVRKLYQGLMVLEQASNRTEFSIDDIKTPRLYYSHLYTAIGYEKFRHFISIPDDFDTPNPVPESHLRQLREVMDWLFGSKKRSVDQIVRTQNPDLRHFVDILDNDMSVAAMRAGKSLEVAYDLSVDETVALKDAFVKIKISMEKASSKLGSYDGDEGLLRQAGTIAQLADSIYSQMERIRDERINGKKPRLTE